MNNPFRDPTLRACFDSGVQGYEAGPRIGSNFFRADGARNVSNSNASMFWRGFDGIQIGQWDRASKQMLGYAYWKAGQACSRDQR